MHSDGLMTFFLKCGVLSCSVRPIHPIHHSSSLCLHPTFSVQVHRAREVRAEGAGLLHLDVRQVDADHAKDAAPLGRGKHAGE